jgi:hypothetical protein
VLLLDALSLPRSHAVADPKWPFARVLTVAGVQGEVELLLGVCQRLVGSLDIRQQVVALGDY